MPRLRNKQLSIRLTEEEIKIVKLKKEKSKIRDMADFILCCLAQTPIIIFDTQPFFEIAEQLKKIGTNINQIAKIANTNDNIYANEIKDLQLQMKKAENLICDGFELCHKLKETLIN